MSSSQQPVPPAPSSHTAPPGPPSPGVIQISRLAYAGVALLAFGAAFPAFGWPAGLGWLLLIPVALLWWVARARTTVDATGITARGAFRSRTLPWTSVKGVRFPKHGFARAVLADGGETTLPAVTFDRLAELAAASHGRIPDPYAPAPAAGPEPEQAARLSPGPEPGEDQ